MSVYGYRPVAFRACNHSSVLSTLVGAAQWGSQGSSIVFSVNSPNCTSANSSCCQTCPEFHFTQARLQPNLAERSGHGLAKQKRLERTAPSGNSAEGMKGRGGTKKQHDIWLQVIGSCAQKLRHAKGERDAIQSERPRDCVPHQRFVFCKTRFVALHEDPNFRADMPHRVRRRGGCTSTRSQWKGGATYQASGDLYCSHTHTSDTAYSVDRCF